MSARFADLHFARPELLPIGALACATAVLLVLFAAWRRRRALARFASRDALASLTGSVSPGRRALKAAMLVAALAAGFLALAQPRFGYHLVERERRGVDLLFAVDTSRSMLAADLRPDRLTRAKLAVRDLVRELPGDRAGLVAFAGEAFLQCPMTLDRAAFERALDELDTEIIPRGGTDLAAAIRESVAAFGESEHDKLLVLLTDGEALEGDALAEAERAREAGVRVFTIGVGTPSGALVMVPGPDGATVPLRDPEGELVRSALDEDALRRVAEITNGAYRALGPSGRGLAELYAAHLAALPRHAVAARTERVYHEQFQWPLALAVLLLLLEPLVGERRRARRAAIAAGAAAVAVAVAIALAPPRALASPLDAARAYRRGAYAEAARAWSEAAERERSPALRFNAGAAAYRAGDYEQAAELFARAVEGAPPSLQQRAYYDLGNAQYRRGEAALGDRERAIDAWRAAVRAYEAALALDRGDADARHNLELVRRRLAALEREAAQHEAGPQGASGDDARDERGPARSSGRPQGEGGEGREGEGHEDDGRARGAQQAPGREGSRGRSEGERGSRGEVGREGSPGREGGEGSQGRADGERERGDGGGEGARGRSGDEGAAQQRSDGEGDRGEGERAAGSQRGSAGERSDGEDDRGGGADGPGSAEGERPAPSGDSARGPRGAGSSGRDPRPPSERGRDARGSEAGGEGEGGADPRAEGREDEDGAPERVVLEGSSGFGAPPGRLSREQALDVLRSVRGEQRRFPLSPRGGEGATREGPRRDW